MMYFRSWSPSTAWLILSLLTSIATVWTGIPLTTCPSWIMSNSGSFIRTARWYTNRYSKWNEYYPRAISRYKRRTNAMCMTLLCLRGLRRQSRHCGPDIASRSPGGLSYTRTLRWVIRSMMRGWLTSDKCINTSGPPQWSGHTQGSSSGHWLVLSIFWQFQTEQNSPGGNYKERACLWHLRLWYCHWCLRG